MTVYTLDPLADARWPEFVQRHPRASVFHTSGFLEALRRTYGYAPVAYTTSAPRAELTNAVVLCRISSWLTGRRMVSLPFADHCEPLTEQSDDTDAILRELRRSVENGFWKYVELRPLNPTVHERPGVTSSGSYCFHTLDLRPSLRDLFCATHKTAIQQAIRRAGREQLRCEEGRSDALLNVFYGLLLQTRRRHKLPPQPIEWFKQLIACLGDRLTIRAAYKDRRPVASILTLRQGHTVAYKYSGSDATVQSLGGTPLLIWNTIQQSKETGAQTMDFGRSDFDNNGLIAFKQRWGAVPSTLHYSRYSPSATASTKGGYGMHFAKRIFTRMPDALLSAAGRILYRHIG